MGKQYDIIDLLWQDKHSLEGEMVMIKRMINNYGSVSFNDLLRLWSNFESQLSIVMQEIDKHKEQKL